MVERSKRIELRVTADELRQIHERMQEAGISSLTAYMIRMALHGYVIVMDLSDLKEVLRLLQISGNNLNQYAKKANETALLSSIEGFHILLCYLIIPHLFFYFFVFAVSCLFL